MPVDHKRINAPEDTVPYSLFVKQEKVDPEQKIKEIINEDSIRADGRGCLEHRKIFLKTGVVSQAKGSAYIEVGKTKVIVSVFDPREIPNKTDYSLKGELYCEFKYAPFSCPRRRSHLQESDEKRNSAILKKALEAVVCRHEFPNFQVDIYALILQNDGSSVSAAITCAGLALAHAAIPMYDLITSVTLGIQRGRKLLDPTLKEEEFCDLALPNVNGEDGNDHGIVILSMLYTHEQISEFHQIGSIGLDNLTESIEILSKSTKELKPLVETCLMKYILKNLKRNVED